MLQSLSSNSLWNVSLLGSSLSKSLNFHSRGIEQSKCHGDSTRDAPELNVQNGNDLPLGFTWDCRGGKKSRAISTRLSGSLRQPLFIRAAASGGPERPA